jgi:c-di-GMP-binding flagellar brake protein YcgR
VETLKSIEEKRRYKRASSNLQLQYRNIKKPGETSRGTFCRNISEGGACFNSSEFVSLACRLVLEISIPSSPKPIKAISKVAWIRRIPSTEQYELGNQFLEITKEDKASIMNFVNNILPKSV